MKIERIEVEGHRDLARVDWSPADLTVVRGGGAIALAEAVFALSQVPRGWHDLGEFWRELQLPLRVTPAGEEAHTTRWRLTCAPRGPSDDQRHAEYELGIYPAAEGLPWEIRYEFLKRYDDFDELEVLRREGAGAEYKLSKPRRGGATAGRKGRESFAGDIPVLGARQELFDDPAVLPFAQPLACWTWYRGFDLTAARRARVYAGFHGRLVERGENLTNALHDLHDRDDTRGALEAALGAALPGHQGVEFEGADDGTVTLWLRRDGARVSAPHLDEGTTRVLCALAAAMATEAPALRWFEPEVFDVPEVLGPHLARCLVAQAVHAHVVLRDPPPWLEAALEAAVSARAEPAPLRAERITVELGDGPSALTPEKFGSLTGLSPVP
jgi:predicted ATPase